MVDKLREVFAQAEQLSAEQQHLHTETIRARLEELRAQAEADAAWDATLNSPEGQDALDQLAAEARREIASGQTRDVRDIL